MVSRRGSAIVPSDRTMATSYMVLIATMFSSAAVWTQFLIKCFKLLWPYLGNGKRCG